MSPIPDGRRSSRREAPKPNGYDDIQMPSLGTWLLQVRKARGLSRSLADELTHVSDDYIAKIEGGFVPRIEILERLIAGYGLNPMQARYTRELWQPAATLPPIDQLRDRIDTPHHRAKLAQFDSIGVICVYTDPLWNVLSANDSFRRALPGVERVEDNISLWFFRDGDDSMSSQHTTLQPEHEAGFHAAMLRGAFGRYRSSPRAAILLNRLQRNNTFRSYFANSTDVAYARQPDDLALLRDTATGESYYISIDISEIADTRDVRVCHAFKQSHMIRHDA